MVRRRRRSTSRRRTGASSACAAAWAWARSGAALPVSPRAHETRPDPSLRSDLLAERLSAGRSRGVPARRLRHGPCEDAPRDVERGLRPAQRPRTVFQPRQAGGVAEERADLEGERRGAVDLDRGAVLEEEIAVARLLAGDGI